MCGNGIGLIDLSQVCPIVCLLLLSINSSVPYMVRYVRTVLPGMCVMWEWLSPGDITTYLGKQRESVLGA